MTTRREAKQYDISENNTNYKIKTKYGTLNKKEPQVIFIRSKGRVKNMSKPINDINKTISLIKNIFYNNVVDILNDTKIFTKEMLCDIDISGKCLMADKSSYMKYDIFVKPIAVKPIDVYEKNIRAILIQINSMLNDILRKNNICML